MPQFDSDRMMKLVSHMREAVRQLKRLKECEKESFLNRLARFLDWPDIA
jgi:hypothetical protein